MKAEQTRKSAHARILTLGLLGLLGVSCVSQQEYDDAYAEAKRLQKALFELEGYQSQLEAENERLKARLDASDVAAGDESWSQEIDERLSNLNQIMAELGPNPGDVTKFQVEGGYVYRVKDSILFATGSTEISDEGQRLLVEVAADIMSRPHGDVFIRGHTDNVPIVKPATMKRFPHGNLQLSASRALEVATVLTKAGKVEEGRVVVMGFGPNEPVAKNASADGRQKNRRVDIFVSDE